MASGHMMGRDMRCGLWSHDGEGHEVWPLVT